MYLLAGTSWCGPREDGGLCCPVASFGDRELSDIVRQIVSKERPLRCPRCKTLWTDNPGTRSGTYVVALACPKCKSEGDVSYTVR